MSQVKITVTRKNMDVIWYQPDTNEVDYIENTFPLLVSQVQYTGLFENSSQFKTLVKTLSGSLKDCQRYINECNDETSILNRAKQYYSSLEFSHRPVKITDTEDQDSSSVTYTVELVN